MERSMIRTGWPFCSPLKSVASCNLSRTRLSAAALILENYNMYRERVETSWNAPLHRWPSLSILSSRLTPVPEKFCHTCTGSGTGDILMSSLVRMSTKVDLPAPTLPSRSTVYGLGLVNREPCCCIWHEGGLIVKGSSEVDSNRMIACVKMDKKDIVASWI